MTDRFAVGQTVISRDLTTGEPVPNSRRRKVLSVLRDAFRDFEDRADGIETDYDPGRLHPAFWYAPAPREDRP